MGMMPGTPSHHKAVAAAEELLQHEFVPDLRTPDGGSLVVLEEQITEYNVAWLVPFNSRAYLVTGDPVEFVLPGACVVPKDAAVQAHFPPTYLPVEEYLEKVSSGDMTWPAA